MTRDSEEKRKPQQIPLKSIGRSYCSEEDLDDLYMEIIHVELQYVIKTALTKRNLQFRKTIKMEI